MYKTPCLIMQGTQKYLNNAASEMNFEKNANKEKWEFKREDPPSGTWEDKWLI